MSAIIIGSFSAPKSFGTNLVEKFFEVFELPIFISRMGGGDFSGSK